MSETKQIVLLTGISGWIGQFCAVELIKNGFYVKGSLRNMDRQNEVVDAIKTQVDPTGSLEFCKLDLLEDDGWDEAANGCTYMLHVASPFVMAVQKDENKLVKPAVEGTMRALNAAKKAGVNRVVLTSSVVSMMGHQKTGSYDTSTWTDVNHSLVTAYQKSKTLAEKAAWDFINNQTGDHTLELTVINPGAVLGPTISDDISGESLNICNELLSGKMPGIPNLSLPMVDVRDVAKHHVQAMVLPEANNKRYISAYDTPTPFIELAKTLNENGFKVPTKRTYIYIANFRLV